MQFDFHFPFQPVLLVPLVPFKMAKITRQPTRKTLPPNERVTEWIKNLLNQESDTLFTIKLKELIENWPIVEDKTDLFHWTDLLNRFDEKLEAILTLHIPIGKLQKSPLTEEEHGLFVAILEVSRILLETCSSRNIYNSYDVRLKSVDDISYICISYKCISKSSLSMLQSFYSASIIC